MQCYVIQPCNGVRQGVRAGATAMAHNLQVHYRYEDGHEQPIVVAGGRQVRPSSVSPDRERDHMVAYYALGSGIHDFTVERYPYHHDHGRYSGYDQSVRVMTGSTGTSVDTKGSASVKIGSGQTPTATVYLY